MTCFQYPFISVMSAFGLTSFFMITGIDYMAMGILSTILSFVIPMATFYFIGKKIYNSYLGPWVRKRGWDESSFLRGLQLEITVLIFIYTLPVFATILIYLGWKTLTH